MGSRTSIFGADEKAVLAAIGRSHAIIEFDTSGVILSANQNFCDAFGYDLHEIVGKHHKMFVDPREAVSDEYKAFWDKLSKGMYDSARYKRYGKGGREIWIEASYNPVLRGSKVYKVIKTATDITASVRQAHEDASKLSAISRSQAMIEFTPHGDIITANENFCTTLGYALSEIVGKHHRVFCEPNYAASDEYRQFWRRLASGEFIANEFVRYGKGGKEIWIQAAYNPILDMNGQVIKVVKFATDVSERMTAVTRLGLALRAMAEGDLRATIEEPFVPSMEQVRLDCNEAVMKLREALLTVGDNAQAISTNSNEMGAAAVDLSRRTEQQAASLEETAAALDQITATVKSAAESAARAANVTGGTRQAAERSGIVVGQAVEAMSHIEKSSQQISQIIGVIDEIAFQTNLLALNAGVEAARAGDAGRGFAVVASEVRALAQRSAEAAKEIKGLISVSTQHVGSGVALVGETGDALTSIVSQIGEISALVSEIAASSSEQATGLSEVNVAVNQMDQVTQKNAAMVEESTAATQKLAEESASLFQLLRQFKLNSDPASEQAHKLRQVTGSRAHAPNLHGREHAA